MQPIHRVQLQVFADYHQFYLVDGGLPWAAPEDWSDADLQNGAKVAESVMVICPARNMSVPVEVSTFATQPPIELAAHDHVVEASLSLPTGLLQLSQCTGPDLLRLSLEAGDYRVRAMFAGLSTIEEDGLEGRDTYTVQVWRGALQELIVLKQWQGEWRG